MRDLKNNVAVRESVAPAAHTGTVTGAAVNLQGYGSAMVVVHVGDWTDGAHAIQVEESDAEGSGFAAVADDDLDGTEPTVDSETPDDQVYTIGYKGSKQYLRVTSADGASPVGATGVVWGASIVLGNPALAPTS